MSGVKEAIRALVDAGLQLCLVEGAPVCDLKFSTIICIASGIRCQAKALTVNGRDAMLLVPETPYLVAVVDALVLALPIVRMPST